jgi:hypothetical protein
VVTSTSSSEDLRHAACFIVSSRRRHRTGSGGAYTARAPHSDRRTAARPRRKARCVARESAPGWRTTPAGTGLRSCETPRTAIVRRTSRSHHSCSLGAGLNSSSWSRSTRARRAQAPPASSSICRTWLGRSANAGALMSFTSPGLTQNSTSSLAVLLRFSLISWKNP